MMDMLALVHVDGKVLANGMRGDVVKGFGCKVGNMAGAVLGADLYYSNRLQTFWYCVSLLDRTRRGYSSGRSVVLCCIVVKKRRSL
jgi:hypothetical protein